ncbi:hypothetical protein SARC_12545 [Sphaeroforma arctica JP610]|uniref:Uncharacterized protein n=1 Tax=Sphaeroforma arctica JP610 TaxID=667725 RepID=A0A0L0FEL6_9EUKA|nr:hypothetical protein SARC_12545 [Sphaeroforma arctica JP610]KNC74921.1 hypothetical protein SARC_12545 [Sphaeroforma arctica JP610]|eukprot:XP_014148823.1 hypothetical protein SARC_12545 [Sphaeroforma arctica JP610]
MTNDTWAQRLDQVQDTILPTLHHITKKCTGKLPKTFDRLYAHDLVHFDEGDVIMTHHLTMNCGQKEECRHIIIHRTNDDTEKLEYLVRWRESNPTWETAEAFDDANDIAAYHKVTQTLRDYRSQIRFYSSTDIVR